LPGTNTLAYLAPTKMPGGDKRSSLFSQSVNGEGKKIYIPLTPN